MAEPDAGVPEPIPAQSRHAQGTLWSVKTLLLNISDSFKEDLLKSMHQYLKSRLKIGMAESVCRKLK